MHLSFMIERSHGGGDEEPCPEVREVLRVGVKCGNSTILSIRGAFTETSMEFVWWRKFALLNGDSSIVARFGRGRDARLLVGPGCFTEVLESHSYTDHRPVSVQFSPVLDKVLVINMMKKENKYYNKI